MADNTDMGRVRAVAFGLLLRSRSRVAVSQNLLSPSPDKNAPYLLHADNLVEAETGRD